MHERLDVIIACLFASLPLLFLLRIHFGVTSTLPCLAMTSVFDVMYPGLTTTIYL